MPTDNQVKFRRVQSLPGTLEADTIYLVQLGASKCRLYVTDNAGTPNAYEALPVLDGSKTYDPGSLADGAGEETTVTVTGAALGDYVRASFSIDLAGVTLSAWVSAADTVTVRFQNETGGVVDLASGTLRARVEKA